MFSHKNEVDVNLIAHFVMESDENLAIIGGLSFLDAHGFRNIIQQQYIWLFVNDEHFPLILVLVFTGWNHQLQIQVLLFDIGNGKVNDMLLVRIKFKHIIYFLPTVYCVIMGDPWLKSHVWLFRWNHYRKVDEIFYLKVLPLH